MANDRSHRYLLAILLVIGAAAARALAEDNRIAPGDFVVERPTLENLGFRWYFSGDANRNATVEVAYRRADDAKWSDGYPLLRMGGESIDWANSNSRWEVPNLFAGSVMRLIPDTTYEVRLTLADPDGVADGKDGKLTKTVNVRTRRMPQAGSDGKTLHLYPAGHGGDKAQPAFDNLETAVKAAAPGDVILVHAGVYPNPHPAEKMQPAFRLAVQAAADRPIVVRAAGDGEAIFDGGGCHTLLHCGGSKFLHLEGLTLRQSAYLIDTGTDGSEGIVVQRCFLDGRDQVQYSDGYAFLLYLAEQNNFDAYIADNTVIGPAAQWHPRTQSEISHYTYGIDVGGQGHVVCHNDVRACWDGIDIGLWSPKKAYPAQCNAAIDIYGNDVSQCVDDGVQLDYGHHNIRFYDNRIHEAFCAISMQPVYGGPAYVLRNVVYNATVAALKPNNWPAGLIVVNNTLVTARSAGSITFMHQNSRFLNNLFLGALRDKSNKQDHALATGTPTPQTLQLDYNGWYIDTPPNSGYYVFFWMKSPRENEGKPVTAKEQGFPTLEEFAAKTGFEKHGMAVTPEIFARFLAPTGDMTPPPADLDLRLKPEAPVVDRGVALPGLTDGYKGKAPDLGAYEVGAAVPVYGPRNSR